MAYLGVWPCGQADKVVVVNVDPLWRFVGVISGGFEHGRSGGAVSSSTGPASPTPSHGGRCGPETIAKICSLCLKSLMLQYISVPKRQSPFLFILVKMRKRALKFLVHFSLVCLGNRIPKPMKMPNGAGNLGVHFPSFRPYRRSRGRFLFDRKAREGGLTFWCWHLHFQQYKSVAL